MTDILKVAVIGAGGRMGQTCCDAIENCTDMQLVARLGRGDEITAQTLRGAQVAVEFTIPNASFANTEAILRAGAHAVVGTSGWD
ncbi:MAG: 4-hydroxy-tetrahydrodipicolinate reductase, partial [Varibaculum timonense]